MTDSVGQPIKFILMSWQATEHARVALEFVADGMTDNLERPR